jgi:MFS transporter, FHS family, L-fucose permease
MKNLDDLREKAASVIVMGVVGGAVLPPIMGYMADKTNVAQAYLLPIICYVMIFIFAVKFYKPTSEKK